MQCVRNVRVSRGHEASYPPWWCSELQAAWHQESSPILLWVMSSTGQNNGLPRLAEFLDLRISILNFNTCEHPFGSCASKRNQCPKKVHHPSVYPSTSTRRLSSYSANMAATHSCEEVSAVTPAYWVNLEYAHITYLHKSLCWLDKDLSDRTRKLLILRVQRWRACRKVVPEQHRVPSCFAEPEQWLNTCLSRGYLGTHEEDDNKSVNSSCLICTKSF